MTEQEKFTFFWAGTFSQWEISEFTFLDMKFNRAEQFMMFCKAMVFNDYESARKIMASDNPSEQKKIGRQVNGFDVDVWAVIAKDIVYTGSYCKYTQNTKLQTKLLDTEGTTLVEASPYDKIWGIGLTEDDPLAWRRDTWDGKNWLGEVLDLVREDIINVESNNDAFKLCERLVKVYRENS